MGGSGSTESKSAVQAQPVARNQVAPVSEAIQAAQEDAARLRQQMRSEKEEHARSLEAAAAADRQRLDEAAADERRRLDSKAAAERKRLDDDAAAQRARLDEENSAERQRLAAAATAEGDADRRRLDEQAAAARQQLDEQAEAQRKRLDEEAAVARKRLDEEAMAERKQLDEQAAVQRKRLDDEVAEQWKRLDEQAAAARQQLDEQAEAQRKRLDEEAVATRKRLDDEAAAERKQLDEQAAEKRKLLDDEAAEQRKRLDEQAAAVRQQPDEQAEAQRKRLDEEAAAARKRLDEEALAARKRLDDEAAAERRRLDGVVAALQQQLQSLFASLASAGPLMAAVREVPKSYTAAAAASEADQPAAPRAASLPTPLPAAAASASAGEETAEAAAERQRREQEAAAAAAVAAVAAAAAAEQRRLQEEAETAERQRLEAIEVAAAAERRKVEEEVERTWTDQDLVASMPDGAVALEALPSSIQDLHDGMPAPLRAAPMRLLRIEAVLAWPNIRVYEEVAAGEALELPYDDVDAAMWDATLILSWRWSSPKPAEHVAGFTPMSAAQFGELATVLRRAAAPPGGGAGMRFVWIDWCCVPQYSAPSMVEVLRSKVFYARARAMTVIPTFVPLPSDGIVRLLLLKAARTVRARADASASPRSAVTARALDAILAKEAVAGREYFTRVWTLAERMARFGRPDQLRNWLSLEAWLGTLVDAMLRSTEDRSASAIYKRILGREAGRALEGVLEPLEAAVKTGSMHVAEGLEGRVAELFELAVGIWHTKQELAEAPTKEWLVSYLLDAHAGIYAAWSDADRVWAIYSYFCWKQLDQRSEAGLLEALQDLVRVAGGSRRLLMCMATKLGLAKALPPAEADKKLVAAAEANQDAEMVAALEAGAFPDYPGTDGGAALYFAAVKGNLEAVRLLIKSGATVDHANVNGETALHGAAAKGHAEVAAALLAAGADIDKTKAGSRTPLHQAVEAGHDGVVRLLLDKGANKEPKDADGRTPLYLAAVTNSKADVMRVLLEGGANKDFKTSAGVTVLHAAASKGCEDTVRLLLHSGLDPNAVNFEDNKFTALHYAADKGHVGVIRALTQNGAKTNATGALGTPLHRACIYGHAGAAEALLAAGAPREAREPGDSKTPLMSAAHNDQVATLKVMISANANVSARDKDGWEPIHFAAKANSYECCKLLKAAGASTKNKTNAGNYPNDLAKDQRVKGILPDGRGLIEGVGTGLLKAFF